MIVAGGGQAGLATAHLARRAGRRPVLLEANDEPLGSWPRYYDSLRLFSPARFSALPGLAFPGDPERYPARDEVVGYLRSYRAGLDVDIRTKQAVRTVIAESGDGGFRVTTAAGTTLTTRTLIAATGWFGAPHVPALPGTFRGRVLHSADYRCPAPFAGQRVVVVGGGNSAVQIAVDLAGSARVSLVTRAALRWAPQRPLGRDIHWWLARTGLDGAPIGPRLAGRGSPVLDAGRYRRAVAAGRPDHRPMFTTADDTQVRWADGRIEDIDTIILATGYRPNLSYLRALGALDAQGRPHHRRGLSTTAPGLAFVGLEYQRSISSATLRGVGRDAEFVLRGMEFGQPRPAFIRP